MGMTLLFRPECSFGILLLDSRKACAVILFLAAQMQMTANLRELLYRKSRSNRSSGTLGQSGQAANGWAVVQRPSSGTV